MANEDQERTDPPAEARTFVIGVTMAGAVSAGAYTAGVLDYLLRALEAHNARVDDPADKTRPRHKVALKVVSGASGGGVCGALGVLGLIKNRKPGTARLDGPIQVGPKGGATSYDLALEPLHDVWVSGLTIWDPDTQEGLLSLEDLRNDRRPVRALLNGTHLDQVADDAVRDIVQKPPPSDGVGYSFLARDLDIFLTITNLAGVPYRVQFAPGGAPAGVASGHAMAQHAAVRHFRVRGLGACDIPSAWLDAWNDIGIDLPLPAPGELLPVLVAGSPWAQFRHTAIATGAFPLALDARPITSRADEFGRVGTASLDTPTRGGALPIDADPRHLGHVRPDFGADVSADDTVRYVAVDGGVMNNEPFEYARFTIRPAAAGHDEFLDVNPRLGSHATRAVIMIDPFPEGPRYEARSPEDVDAERGLVAVLGQLVPALRNQARFKLSELLFAADTSIYSRYLISPSRGPRSATSGSEGHVGADAIASGGLQGFLGFFDERFRVHDFMLGQRNCQRFLIEHFSLPKENGLLGLGGAPGDQTKVRIVDPGAAFEWTRREPPWPVLESSDLEPTLAVAARRLGRVGKALVAQHSPSRLLSILLDWLWEVRWPVSGIQSFTRARLRRLIMRQLIEREQHTHGFGQSTGTRQVLVTLVEAGHRPQTVHDLHRSLHEIYGDEAVPTAIGDTRKILESLARGGVAWRSPGGVLSGVPKYAHMLFRPSWLAATRLRLTG